MDGLTVYHLIEFLITGSVAGILAGFFGIGGGIVMIPVLLIIFKKMGISEDVIVQVTFGTCIAASIFTSLLSSITHTKNGNVVWKQVFFMASTGIVGSLVGSTLASHTRGDLLRLLFGWLLVYVSLQLFFRKNGEKNIYEGKHYNVPITNLFIGFITGLIASFFGIGGGTIAVPLMTFTVNTPVHRAVGNSSSLIVFLSLFATIGYVYNGLGNSSLPGYTIGFIHIIAWFLLTISGAVTAPQGAKLSKKTDAKKLKKYFSILLAIIGTKMVLF
ncbi:MAG: sulfite exporter TauE/SafE family protein [Thermodesulfobacteriota bacterium]|nr:sulfite exporter TauE/SafE family protein [Thermodesulfobacteriota bacterium]